MIPDAFLCAHAPPVLVCSQLEMGSCVFSAGDGMPRKFPIHGGADNVKCVEEERRRRHREDHGARHEYIHIKGTGRASKTEVAVD